MGIDRKWIKISIFGIIGLIGLTLLFRFKPSPTGFLKFVDGLFSGEFEQVDREKEVYKNALVELSEKYQALERKKDKIQVELNNATVKVKDWENRWSKFKVKEIKEMPKGVNEIAQVFTDLGYPASVRKCR